MGEPTYRPLTDDDLRLPGDALPGLLDGWCGPLETRIGAMWRPAVMDPFGTRPVWQPTFDAPVHRLDCRRPEVRDHARRVLLAAGHDIGPIIEAELRGDITPTEAAGLVWCSLLRVEARMTPVNGWAHRLDFTNTRGAVGSFLGRAYNWLKDSNDGLFPPRSASQCFDAMDPPPDEPYGWRWGSAYGPELGDAGRDRIHAAALAAAYALRSDGALLMPMPDGVIGHLEVSDG